MDSNYSASVKAPIDRRDARRIIVGPDFGISFTLKGSAFGQVRIANLSAEGCFAFVRKQEAGLFKRGAVLECLLLLHPDLPKTPVLAEVCHVLGGTPAEPLEMVGIGIHFLNMDDPSRKLLDAWVDAAMASL
ncbi:MAG: PilZ domain-containing protein [Holophagaceae bacterium]